MNYLYVALFGALGAASRYGISISMSSETFPYNTLMINIIGCFLLAVTVRSLAALPMLSKNLVNGIGIGFIGSFTTFSAFGVEVSEMLIQGDLVLACIYAVSSVIGGFLSAGLGVYFGDCLIRRKERRENGN
ncbi:MAG: CrcB family protein [Clostridia bacterium]|nr:CrcB family protein [Clostridia bacterium]